MNCVVLSPTASMIGMPLTKADSKPSSKLMDTTPSGLEVTAFPPLQPMSNKHETQTLKVRIQEFLELAHTEFNVPDFHAKDHLIGDQLISKCNGIARVYALERTKISVDLLIVAMQNHELCFLNLQRVSDLVLQNCGLINSVIKLRLFPIDVSSFGLINVPIDAAAPQIVG